MQCVEPECHCSVVKTKSDAMGRLATREISLLPQILRHRVLRVYFLISIFGPDSGHLRNLLGESFGMVLRGREPGDGLTTDL